MSAKELVEELEQVANNYNVIAEKYKDVKAIDIPAEDRTKLAKLQSRGSELKVAIEEEQKLESSRKDMDDLKSFLEKPAPKVAQPTAAVNDDKDGRKALEAAGWEFKNGLAYKSTSQGKAVEMFSEKVLFGPVSAEPGEARYAKQTRATMQPVYRETFNKYLQIAIKTRSESMAFSMLTSAEQKALSEGQDDAGGYLVPPDVQAEVLVRLAQFSVIRRYARVQTTSRDTLRWPRVQPASATAGGVASGGASIFSSGFVGSWAGETPAFSDTDPSFGQFDISIKKIRTATKLSNDFIADSAVDILAFLARNGAENMGLVEDFGFFQGNGAGLQPLGILNAGATTVDVEGSTANTITNTTAATGTAPKLLDVLYAVPPQYRNGSCVWVMTPASEGKTRKLVDANGRYMFPIEPSLGSGLGSGRGLLGYQVENSPFMPEDGTDTNKVYLFGDLSNYIIAQRTQISTVVLRERFADTDQTGIILFERVGGALWNTDAIRYGVV